MAIEQERGISVTSAAMQFEYQDHVINLLDTPGHQDFSEDTYRALTAADSVVMLLDCAKGVEEQTKKLFRVARNGDLPIFTFVNKLDRPGREPVELIDEVEELFGLHAVPMTWPIGSGHGLQGRLRARHRADPGVRAHQGRAQGPPGRAGRAGRPGDPGPAHRPGTPAAARTTSSSWTTCCPAFDLDEFLAGRQSPMFFGSALNNFGVAEFLEEFLDMAPAPHARPLAERRRDPRWTPRSPPSCSRSRPT